MSLDEAIDRAKMARDLGVDALFVEAPESITEMERIARELSGTVLVANMVEKGRTPLLSTAELADLGFRLIVSPLSLLLSATRAMQQAATQLAESGTLRDRLESVTPFDEFTGIVGLPEHLDREDRYR